VAADDEQHGAGMTGTIGRAAAASMAPARRAFELLGRSSGVDWDAEGLLGSTVGEAREQRKRLLESLCRAGVPLPELRRAVEEERLAMLPVERALEGQDRYTCRELAEQCGLDVDDLRGDFVALGLAVPASETKAFDEHDLETARAIAAFREAGLDPRGLRGVGRVLGQCLGTVASAVRELVGEAALEPGVGEHDLAVRYTELASALTPQLATMVSHALRVHVREGIRDDIVRDLERHTGRLPETAKRCIAFADLVEFTALGDGMSAARAAEVGDRFATLAAESAGPGVRLVKLLGDGAMFAASEPAALVTAMAQLTAAARDDVEDLPALRIGVATGEVITRRGDVYGSTVNLASRLCAVAEPSTLVADNATRDDIPGIAWAETRTERIKGLDEPVEVSVRRLDSIER
jgi:adenylate cyclase